MKFDRRSCPEESNIVAIIRWFFACNQNAEMMSKLRFAKSPVWGTDTKLSHWTIQTNCLSPYLSNW
jgi:hypothetical protein